MSVFPTVPTDTWSAGGSHSILLCYPNSSDLSLPHHYVPLLCKFILPYDLSECIMLCTYCSFSHNSLRYVCFLLYLLISNVFGTFSGFLCPFSTLALFWNFLCPFPTLSPPFYSLFGAFRDFLSSSFLSSQSTLQSYQFIYLFHTVS